MNFHTILVLPPNCWRWLILFWLSPLLGLGDILFIEYIWDSFTCRCVEEVCDKDIAEDIADIGCCWYSIWNSHTLCLKNLWRYGIPYDNFGLGFCVLWKEPSFNGSTLFEYFIFYSNFILLEHEILNKWDIK